MRNFWAKNEYHATIVSINSYNINCFINGYANELVNEFTTNK